MFVRYAILAAGLVISHANLAERAGAVEISKAVIEETEQLVRDTLTDNGLPPDEKTRLAHFIAPELDRDRFVSALERQGIGNERSRLRLWKKALDKASIGGPSLIRDGSLAVAVLLGEPDGASQRERLAHEFFHGLLAPANDIPNSFEEGFAEVLTEKALGTTFVGTADYVAAKAVLEALIGTTSVQMVSNAYQGQKRARRSIDDKIGQNLAKVRSMLAKDSSFTDKLLSSSSVKGKDRKTIKALQNPASSAWDVLLGLFEAKEHAWAVDAALWHQKGKEEGRSDLWEICRGNGDKPALSAAGGFLGERPTAFSGQLRSKNPFAAELVTSRSRLLYSLSGAVMAYRAAIEKCSRERARLQWARTQNNLGNALSPLG